MNTPVKRRIRCAVYTRKSHEEGLDMEFNTLEAQREAGENYIASQKHEGWMLLPDYYDDGGFSGGNLDRPSLKRLMADIRAGKIDVVIIYKIDRLTRSLLDFAQLMEVFDAHNVSFVSVTQNFNTATSMGRLLLNVLLSFAQFEREVTGERIRDKIAASKKRGMWMGGQPPLGYDIVDRKLIINEKEAAQVRSIFEGFLDLKSVTLLVKELRKEGVRTKSFITQKKKQRHGKLFDKNQVYRTLRNRLYIGEITHKDKSYPGQHTPIIEQPLWDKVDKLIQESPRDNINVTLARIPSLLRGLVRCGGCKSIMSPTHTRKNGRKYRYYKASKAIKGECDGCPVQAVPAGDLEKLVVGQLRQVFLAPEMIVKTWAEAKKHDPRISESEVMKALRDIHPVWDELFPTEQARIVNLLVESITVNDTNVNIHMRTDGLESLARDLSANNQKEREAA